MTVDMTYLEQAGFLFERARGVYDDYKEFRLHNSKVAELPVEQVLTVVSSYIAKEIQSPSKLLPEAIFALGQSHDFRFSTLYLDVMKKAQMTNISASFQAALAYEKLGIQVFKNKDLILEEEDIITAINAFFKENQ